MGPTVTILNSNGQPAYDSAPGGLLDLPGSLNNNPDNASADAGSLPTRSCFIPTASAFGMSLTNNNMYFPWQGGGFALPEHSINKTPFDAILLQGTNEDHITISTSTALWIKNQIAYSVSNQSNITFDAYKSFIPIPTLPPITIEAKSFTFTPLSSTPHPTIPAGSVMNLKASEKIVLEPGFTAEKGSFFTASISETAVTCYTDACKIASYYTTGSNEKYQTLSNQQNEFYNPVLIFPNPSDGTFVVGTFNSTIQNIQVMDVLGNIIHSTNSANRMIDVSSAPPGIYFIKIQTADGIYTEKLVISH